MAAETKLSYRPRQPFLEAIKGTVASKRMTHDFKRRRL